MNNAEFTEKRRSRRKFLRLPIQLQVLNGKTGTSPKVLSCYATNINQHGLGLDLSLELPVEKNASIPVTFNNLKKNQPVTLLAKLVWTSQSQCGFEFLEKPQDIESLLLEPVPLQETPGLKRFYPYVEDEDRDTGKYEYIPYADQIIAEPIKTRICMLHLKKGEKAADAASTIYAQCAVADSELNTAAVAAAHKAYQEFRHFSLERRRAILDDIRELLIEEKENILKLLEIEGHPRKLAEWEFSGMLTAHSRESLSYYQSHMLETMSTQGRETLIVVRRSQGVFCVCPPKNASCSNSLLASFAILAGNTLVVKPPLSTPLSTIYLWRNIVSKALKKNNAPKGTINIVLGNSKEFMEDWLEDPRVKGVLLFNNSDSGLEMGKKIYEKGKKPILELSGNDFLVVWKDAPLEQAAESLLEGFMGSTQICMVPKKALIHSEAYPSFVKIFLEKVKKLKFGLPSDPQTILSPVVKMGDFFQHLEDALKNGAKLLTGGKRVNHRGEENENGFYLLPTVVEIPFDRASSFRCVAEENFFPLMPLICVQGEGAGEREKDHNTFEKMMQILSANEFGLRISAWVRDPFYLKKFIAEAQYSGLLRLNSRHVDFSVCLSTHGGIGKTGGPFGEMNYIWEKTSYLQGISVTPLNPEN